MGGGEMPARQDRGHSTHGFFGKGGCQVATSKPRLNMAKWDSCIESCQRSTEHGDCVALGENRVGSFKPEVAFKLRDEPTGYFPRCLVGGHDVKIPIRHQGKDP